jgi:hypothetical protein
MDALDGNAIAGALVDVFGAELTTATGRCASCGAQSLLGELQVYVQAPGVVARCRACAAVLLVLVTIRGITCVDMRGLDRLEPAPTP